MAFYNQFTLSFTLPAIPNIAGVELWEAYYTSTGTYSKVDTKLIGDIPTSSGVYYYTYTTFVGPVDGTFMYYKTRYFTTTNIFSTFSLPVEIITIPTPVSNLSVWWDGAAVNLEWDLVSTSSGQNLTVDSYAIVRKELNLLSGHTFTPIDAFSGVLENLFYTSTGVALIFHPGTETYWYGQITSTGSFLISRSNMIPGGELTSSCENMQASDLLVYYNSVPLISDVIGTVPSSTGFYIDSTSVINTRYVYGVITQDSINLRRSLTMNRHAFTKDFSLAIPRIRRLGNSSTSYLDVDTSSNWMGMKNALIDENFYDKEVNAIPFSTSNTNLKGWVGIGKVLVDVYQNNKYALTTSTGVYGELSFNLLLEKDQNGVGLNVIKLQVRNGPLISRYSSAYTYNVYNMYTIFAALGEVLNDYSDEMSLVKNDNYIALARSSALESNFGSVVSVNKQNGWTTEVYRQVLKEIWDAYNFSATIKGLNDIIMAFPEVDHIEIYPRLSNRPTYRTGVTYVGTSELVGEDYTYGVAAYKTTGELTPPISLRVDKRWWPTDYRGTNILTWEGVSSANGYYIYRGTSSGALGLIASQSGTTFFDDGSMTPTGIEPLTLNYSGMPEPSNLVSENSFVGRNLIYKKQSVNSVHIIVYGFAGSPIAAEKQTLITTLIHKIIPSSLKTIITYTS